MAVAEPQLRTLSPAQVDKFHVDGYLVVEDLLTPDEVADLAERADLIAAGKADHIPEESIQLERIFREGEREVENQVLSVRKLYNLAVYDDLLWGHVTNPKIVDVIADLMGTDDIKLYGDQLFMKPPEIGAAQAWHQDSAAWRDILPMDLVTAWTSIDHATTENGCLNFAPGTHRWGMLTRPRLEPLLDDLGTDRMAGSAGAAGPGKRQLPPQPGAASEQRQYDRHAPSRLRHPLHAGQLVQGRGSDRRAQDAPVQAGPRTLVPRPSLTNCRTSSH